VNTQRGFGRAWDRITVYLPIILMGVLALATYWLARNTPVFAPPVQQRPLTHDADYFLKNFSVKSFDTRGRLKSELRGTEAHHYPDTDTTEVEQPRVRAFSQSGATIVASAKRGISNSDGSQVQLIGDAVVTRDNKLPNGQPEPTMQIRGEFLHFFVDTEQVRSHLPVTLVRGSDVFNGDKLEYDNLNRVADLTGHVHGVLQARPVGGAAGAPAAAARKPAP
jgi:lipopolysaccharide export system protein LptC